MEEQKAAFERIVDIVKQLRHPQTGCPWDIKQTHLSLIPYLIEESYEVAQALSQADDVELIEELGDLLLQILLHSQIAEEAARFSIVDVLKVASDKLVRRHPHVFGELKLGSVEAVLENWEKIKSAEGKVKKKEGLLTGIPTSLPALLKADRMGARASRIGLDWSEAQAVVPKIKEELDEFISASQNSKLTKEDAQAEFGDLLFSLVQYARKSEFDAEQCLQQACDKFARRVQFVESKLPQEKSQLSPEQLDSLWEEAKNQSL